MVPNSNELPLEVLMQRTLDTIEDVAVHLRRIPFEKGGQQLSPREEETRKTVVVLGSGWAAHALMKVVDCRKIRLIVVSPANHFVFHPMLPSAAVGTVEYRSMTEPVRATNPMIEGTMSLRNAASQLFTIIHPSYISFLFFVHRLPRRKSRGRQRQRQDCHCQDEQPIGQCSRGRAAAIRREV